MKLISLEDLPDNFKVGLENEFQIELFRKAIEKLGKRKPLAKELRCHPNTVSKMKKNYLFIKIFRLKKLAEITQVPLQDIEKKVISIGIFTKKQKGVKFKLPLESTPELSSLIGHGMGDGWLRDNFEFGFFNNRKELIDEVTKCMQIAFSTTLEPTERKYKPGEIIFSSKIGIMLELAGLPKGEKVFKPFDVPKWILHGNKEIKIAFIRALFDDEGWVKVKFIRQSSSTQRMIGINMTKSVEFINEHNNFLENIRTMLLDLGIKSSKIVEMGKSVNGVNLGFIISNLENLKKFLVIIGFTHIAKRNRLVDCLEKSKKFNQLFPSIIQTFKENI